jgi:hypothetical protein
MLEEEEVIIVWELSKGDFDSTKKQYPERM